MNLLVSNISNIVFNGKYLIKCIADSTEDGISIKFYSFYSEIKYWPYAIVRALKNIPKHRKSAISFCIRAVGADNKTRMRD
jgi:hypothetical protein